jgi:hypothetical protein
MFRGPAQAPGPCAACRSAIATPSAAVCADDVVAFLEEQAREQHDVDVLDRHVSSDCDACAARFGLTMLARSNLVGSYGGGAVVRQAALKRALSRFAAKLYCDCNFPGAGESGVIYGAACRARDLLHMPQLWKHVERATALEDSRG